MKTQSSHAMQEGSDVRYQWWEARGDLGEPFATLGRCGFAVLVECWQGQRFLVLKRKFVEQKNDCNQIVNDKIKGRRDKNVKKKKKSDERLEKGEGESRRRGRKDFWWKAWHS